MRALGIVLIVLGLLAMVLPYVSFTRKEKAIDVGPIEVVKEKKESIPISPLVGTIVFVAGVGIVVTCVARKRS